MTLSTPRGGSVPARRIALAIVLVAVVCLVAAGGCGRRGPLHPKVVLIGVDGVDWNVADPLLREGKLPNIARIIERGTRADFQSLEYGVKSPIIWTTIATGKGAQKHGISDFLEGTDEAPLFNSRGWRARAVWDILGERGHTVWVINWMVTWPAKPVNGYNVTDHIVYTEEDGFDPIEGVTYPEELREELKPRLRSLASVTHDEIGFLLNGDLWRTGEVPILNEAVENVSLIYAGDQTAANVTMYLLETREQPDLLAVYFNGADVTSHYFWGPMDPSTVDIQMPDVLIETCRDVVPRYYERIDALVGEILDRVDESSTVILCSDHGFRGPVRTPQGLKLGIWMHRPVGVLTAMGPGIVPGSVAADASVFDITPTLLALYGEPVARDMDGFVLTRMLDPHVVGAEEIAYIDTYEREVGSPEPEEPIESPVDDEIKERLRALGYIE